MEEEETCMSSLVASGIARITRIPRKLSNSRRIFIVIVMMSLAARVAAAATAGKAFVPWLMAVCVSSESLSLPRSPAAAMP